jgi:hypothetical protein
MGVTAGIFLASILLKGDALFSLYKIYMVSSLKHLLQIFQTRIYPCMYNSFSRDHRTSDSVDQSIYSGAVRCEKSAFNLTSQNIAGSLLQYTYRINVRDGAKNWTHESLNASVCKKDLI